MLQQKDKVMACFHFSSAAVFVEPLQVSSFCRLRASSFTPQICCLLIAKLQTQEPQSLIPEMKILLSDLHCEFANSEVTRSNSEG